MKSSRIWAWIVLGRSAWRIFFLPLIATVEFSMRLRREAYSFDAYRIVLADPGFHASFSYSVIVALLTILVGVVIVVPTAYWVRLRLPWLRPMIEFVTLLPLIIPRDRHRLRLYPPLQLLLLAAVHRFGAAAPISC